MTRPTGVRAWQRVPHVEGSRQTGVQVGAPSLDQGRQPVTHKRPEPVPASVAGTSELPADARIVGVKRLRAR